MRRKRIAERKTEVRGSRCQNCGLFRRVGINGKLPPHQCASPRPSFPSSPARRVIDMTDDGMSSFIRQVCYGQGR